MNATLCRTCGAALLEGDRFCEQCGAGVLPAAAAAEGATAVVRAPESAPAGGCRSCGAPAEAIGEDGYCSLCGVRERTPPSRDELDLLTAAAVSDQGLVHRRNEDAFALEVVDGRGVAAVVCDGVSTASASDAAARSAADAASAVLARALADSAPDPSAVILDAIAAAQDAVAQVPWTTRADRADPSCTLVCAICLIGTIVVGWVGDSRAYWADPTGARQLTVDDSWAEQQIDAGLLSASQAFADPRSHAITNWVGADAPVQPPRVTILSPERAGRLILCTDGLWNYAPTPRQLAALLDAVPAGAGPAAIARELTAAALAKGGHDNITVVVVDHHPSQGGT